MENCTLLVLGRCLKDRLFQILREYWKLKVFKYWENIENWKFWELRRLRTKVNHLQPIRDTAAWLGWRSSCFPVRYCYPCICISSLYLYFNFVFVFQFCICISILYLYLIFCLQFCLQLRYDFVEQGVSGDEREVFQSMMASSFNFPEFLPLLH